MIRRPPRSTLSSSSAASDVYKRQLLTEPNLTDEEQQEFIRIIGQSGARMLNTINNIVDISKIESGLINVDIKESNINEQIEFIYKFFKPEVESKGLQLSLIHIS